MIARRWPTLIDGGFVCYVGRAVRFWDVGVHGRDGGDMVPPPQLNAAWAGQCLGCYVRTFSATDFIWRNSSR